MKDYAPQFNKTNYSDTVFTALLVILSIIVLIALIWAFKIDLSCTEIVGNTCI